MTHPSVSNIDVYPKMITHTQNITPRFGMQNEDLGVQDLEFFFEITNEGTWFNLSSDKLFDGYNLDNSPVIPIDKQGTADRWLGYF